MALRLVDSGWDREFIRALERDHRAVRVCSPFIKLRATERLLAHGRPETLEVITRFDLADFAARVSDTSALRLLLDAGATIRGVKRLHAKVFFLGADHVIVTSANLTERGLRTNHEFGFVANDPEVVDPALRYFRSLWGRAGSDLTIERIDHWDQTIAAVRVRGAAPAMIDDLPDEGAEAGLAEDAPVVLPRDADSSDIAASAVATIPTFEDAGQAFVKFFGRSDDRALPSASVLHEVRRAGCHWACTYPRRPRQTRPGALIFMARLVRGPKDIRIFGFGVGDEHVPGRDDATDADIALRPWKSRWPHYIRIDGARFVDGTLACGVSLYELMDDLGPLCFATTKARAEAGEVGISPRMAYARQAAVELSPEGTAWVAERLAAGFARRGVIQRASMDTLDWPAL
jgi:hypothetical protein